MKTVELDKAVPDFSYSATKDKSGKLSDFRGQNLVLYFYPKDNTPGCTLEGQDFTKAMKQFTASNTVILGVSRDSLKSHEDFIQKQCFTFELIHDSDETLCELFQVMKMKNMYGKSIRGIERSTFLIDAKGILRAEWRGVKVPGHVDEILEKVKAL